MENQNALLWEVAPFELILITVILGGGAAWMTGRSIAQSWGPNLVLGFYIVLLTAAVRFIHFSLYGGTLISLAVLCGGFDHIAGHRICRKATYAQQPNGHAVRL